MIPATLAHWLQVSAPAVTMALKRLKRDGFVERISIDAVAGLCAGGTDKATEMCDRSTSAGSMESEQRVQQDVQQDVQRGHLEHLLLSPEK